MTDHTLPSDLETSRRGLFVGALALAALATGGALMLAAPRHRYLHAVLRERLPYARFDDGTADAFIADLLVAVPGLSEPAGWGVAILGQRRAAPVAEMISTRLGERTRAKEEAIAALFLLSTDFFDTPEAGHNLHYFGLADPYVAGCPNPFARLAE